MSNDTDEAGKDRLTSDEFVDLIPHLPFGNLLEIEFFSNEWKRLLEISDASRRLYRCVLCNLNQIGHKSVSSHINGKKHLANVKIVNFFYHPEYTFTKVQLQTIETKGSEVNSRSYTTNVKKLPNSEEFFKNDLEATVSNVEIKSITESSLDLGSKEDGPKKSAKTTPTKISNAVQLTNATTKEKFDATKREPKKSLQDYNIPDKLNMKSESSGHWTNPTHEHCEVKLGEESIMKFNKQEKIQTKPSVRVVPLVQLQNKHISNPTQAMKVFTADDFPLNEPKKENVEKCSLLKTSDQTGDNLKNFSCETHVELKQNYESAHEGKCNETALISSHSSSTNRATRCSYEKNMESKTSLGYINSKNMDEEITTNVAGTVSILPTKTETKLVKNPLAAKKSAQSLPSINTLQNRSSKSDSGIDIIIIDDNDDKHSLANSSDILEPPLKRQKASLELSKEDVEVKKYNVSPKSSKLSVVSPKPRERLSNLKDNDNPIFAVQSVRDNYDGICGFVGVEYVIKILRNNAPTKYECGLCELVLDGQTMQNHLLGYNHRLKFCEKHFPTSVQQFRQYILNVSPDEHYKVMIPILEKLTVAIEEHHGRCLPFECDERRYNLERHKVLTEVFARRHASEQRGPTFTHVVDSKQVDDFILSKDVKKAQISTNSVYFDQQKTKGSNQTINQEVQWLPNRPRNQSTENILPKDKCAQSNGIFSLACANSVVDDETHKRMVESFLKANTKNNTFEYKSFRTLRRQKEERNTKLSKRSHSPLRTDYNSKRSENLSPHIWSSYCRLVDSKLKSLRDSFQQYRKNPESHPAYNEEWKKFWHWRKTELITMGKNYRTYDFQPEWVQYFKNRIIEIYDEEFENLKKNTREELFLPMTNDFLCDPKYFVHIKEDKKKFEINKTGCLKTSEFLTSGLQNDVPMNIVEKDQIKPSRTARERHDCFAEHATELSVGGVQIRDEASPTLVSVLRLLTAFEELLGSLGPKIVDLLSKALQAEKTNDYHAENLLTKENCTVLETAMEKFKGLVIAGILDTPKERAIKKAISKVNAFLECAKYIKERNSSSSNTLEDDQRNLNSKDPFQKPQHSINEKLRHALLADFNTNDISKVIHLIEEKIATSLKAQGHTNIDPAQLEQLAAVCVLLEKKKQDSGTSINQRLTINKLHKPLSDTLKKIVGTISSSSSDHTEEKTPSNASEHGKITNIFSSTLRLQGAPITSNLGSLIPLLSSWNPQGRMSSFFAENQNSNRMDIDCIDTSIPQLRSWQQHHQIQTQQKNPHPSAAPMQRWTHYGNPSSTGEQGKFS